MFVHISRQWHRSCVFMQMLSLVYNNTIIYMFTQTGNLSVTTQFLWTLLPPKSHFTSMSPSWAGPRQWLQSLNRVFCPLHLLSPKITPYHRTHNKQLSQRCRLLNFKWTSDGIYWIYDMWIWWIYDVYIIPDKINTDYAQCTWVLMSLNYYLFWLYKFNSSSH